MSPVQVSSPPNFYRQVWDIVRLVPRGRVVSYGQVATWIGSPRAARAVGYAMFNSPEGEEIPWHRVVNAQGKISEGGAPDRAEVQRGLLLAEGVEFGGETGAVDLQRFGLRLPPRRPT